MQTGGRMNKEKQWVLGREGEREREGETPGFRFVAQVSNSYLGLWAAHSGWRGLSGPHSA